MQRVRCRILVPPARLRIGETGVRTVVMVDNGKTKRLAGVILIGQEIALLAFGDFLRV